MCPRGSCSAARRAARHAALLQELEGGFQYRQSWQATYLAKKHPRAAHAPASTRVGTFFSDVLYQPWRCASAPLRTKWVSTESIPRVSGLSAAQFQSNFERRNTPVIVCDGVRPVGWPAWTPTHIQGAVA